jgi:AraC-like DNA-binding protein
MHQSSTGIALLVDIENIKISTALEAAIINMFLPTTVIKIAVGNWQLLKGIDQELVDRGYHLFHVPTGKNNADHELINLGWMLKDTDELVIVSNDKIFIQFAHKLKFGIKATSIVYYSQPQSAFVVTKTQVLLTEAKQLPKKSKLEINAQRTEITEVKKDGQSLTARSELISFSSQLQLTKALKKLVSENKSINNPGTLGGEFRKKFGISASSIIANFPAPVSFTKFVVENEILADMSPKDELITNIRKLIQAHPNLAKESGRISTEFKKIYGVSISEKMKQLNIPGKLSNFIAEIQPDRNCDQN